MENRRKFYTGGLWSKDNLNLRYENICWALDAYNNKKIDDEEFKFIIKNGFVSKIYISKGVYCKYNAKDFGAQDVVYNKILNGNHDVLGTDIFDICKAVENYTQGIIIEHVVPLKEYLPDIKAINKEQDFIDIFNVVYICLVTLEEDERLRKNKLSQKMPQGVDYKKDPFARYKIAEIEVLP